MCAQTLTLKGPYKSQLNTNISLILQVYNYLNMKKEQDSTAVDLFSGGIYKV